MEQKKVIQLKETNHLAVIPEAQSRSCSSDLPCFPSAIQACLPTAKNQKAMWTGL
jgi:hypothetical protein